MRNLDSSPGSGQSVIPPILVAHHRIARSKRAALLSACQPDTMRYRRSEAPIEPSKTRAHCASGQPEWLAPSGGMTDCPITELPSLQCSHCTGSEDKNRFDPDVDYQTGKRFDILLPEARQFSALNDGPRRESQSDRTIQSEHRRTTTTGIYNKTDLVYGGRDSQINYLDVELNDETAIRFKKNTP